MRFNIKKMAIPLSVLGTSIGGLVIWKDYIGGVRVSPDIQIIGRTAIVTGATSGIGKEVSMDLAKRGGRILMACRDLEKCEKIKEDIVKESFNTNVHCRKLNLASLKSIRDFAEDVNKNEKRLDILINNAGVMGMKQREVTKDGFETHLGVNYLGHFLLTNLLLKKLKDSAPSRIINTAKTTVSKDKIIFDDLNMDKSYSWQTAYGQSKLANFAFTKELISRLKGTHVSTYCVLPGLTKTNISSNLSVKKSYISSIILGPFLWIIQKTPVQGAQPTIYCAVDTSVIEKSGIYDSKLNMVLSKNNEILPEKETQRLWIISEKWTRLEETSL